MTGEDGSLRLKLQIAAPPERVYQAWTEAADLTGWLCNVAQVEPHPRGRLYLWWESGYYASGEFMTLKAPEKLVFYWRGRGDRTRSRVKVSLKPEGNGTRLTLAHELGAHEKTAAVRKGWKLGLENLKSVLEEGRDLRVAHQPVLGLAAALTLSPHLAKEKGLPVSEGLWIEAVREGYGAQQAGLQASDLLVKVDGVKIKSPTSLLKALAGKRPGEKVKVVYYRQGRKRDARVTLTRRTEG